VRSLELFGDLHSFNKYLMNILTLSGTALGNWNPTVERKKKVLSAKGLSMEAR
jgi:hypothetical protein